MRDPRRLLPALAVALFVGAANAAVPVALPRGEDPAAWADLLNQAGLSVGAAGTGPSVEMIDQGDSWLLRARDAQGRVQEANVPPPRTPQEREDVLWLVRNLMKTPGGADPVAAAPAPVPQKIAAAPPPQKLAPAAAPTPAPAPAPAPKATVAASAGPATPAAAPVASAATAASPGVEAPAVVKNAAPSAGGGLRGELGVGLDVRPETALAPDLRAGVALPVGESLRVGAGVAWSPARGLNALGEERRVGALDLLAQASWVFPGRIAPEVGVAGGVSLRSFSEAGAPVGSAAIPVLGAGASLGIPLVGPFAVAPFAEARADLRETQTRIGDAPGASVPGFEARAGVGFRYEAGRP